MVVDGLGEELNGAVKVALDSKDPSKTPENDPLTPSESKTRKRAFFRDTFFGENIGRANPPHSLIPEEARTRFMGHNISHHRCHWRLPASHLRGCV